MPKLEVFKREGQYGWAFKTQSGFTYYNYRTKQEAQTEADLYAACCDHENRNN